MSYIINNTNRTYPSLLVHLEMGRVNTGLLRVAADLAAQFKSRVMGMALCQPILVDYGDGYVDFELIEANRRDIARQVVDAEAEFRAAFQGLSGSHVALSWRSAVLTTALADEMATQARTADLILTTDPSGDSLDGSRNLSRSALILQAGRPVLMVPPALGGLRLQHALIAWQDTRECRRAVSDALPLLQWAGLVSVAEIGPPEGLARSTERLADVTAWLRSHGVQAEALPTAANGSDTALQLKRIAQALRAELIVAGAYGHSRLREWALGGVTRDLLTQAEGCTLLSH